MAGSILVITGPSGVGKSAVSDLVSRSFDPGVRIRIDDVEQLILSGRVEQSSPRAGHQNHVVGSAVASAAMQFAVGGYTTVIDGCIFPDVLPGLAGACASHGVELHYAVLRAGHDVCRERATRRSGDLDAAAFRALYDRFAALGPYEASVVDAAAGVEAVAADVRARYDDGRLRVRSN